MLSQVFVPDHELETLAFWDACEPWSKVGRSVSVPTSRIPRACGFRHLEQVWCQERIEPGHQYTRVTVFPHRALVSVEGKYEDFKVGHFKRSLCMRCAARVGAITPKPVPAI